MAWKDLFINDKNKTQDTTKVTVESKKVKETIVATKFPSLSENSQVSNFGFSQTNQTQIKTSGQVSQEYLTKFLDAYENAFNELNQSGYDFFEFFQSVIHADINNPQTYTMAFAVGKGMDKTISKEKLLSQSEFYINELKNLYNKNSSDGVKKKQDFIQQKENENESLTLELNSFKQQLEGIQIQIQDRERKISLIESKYQPKIAECDSKILANDFANNQIISSIETVKHGINQNLK